MRESGSKLRALQTLRALRMRLSPVVFITSLRFLSLRLSAFLCASALICQEPQQSRSAQSDRFPADFMFQLTLDEAEAAPLQDSNLEP